MARYDMLPSFGVRDLADNVSNLANSQWVHVQAKAYRTAGLPSRVSGHNPCQGRPAVTKSVKHPLVWRAKLRGYKDSQIPISMHFLGVPPGVCSELSGLLMWHVSSQFTALRCGYSLNAVTVGTCCSCRNAATSTS